MHMPTLKIHRKRVGMTGDIRFRKQRFTGRMILQALAGSGCIFLLKKRLREGQHQHGNEEQAQGQQQLVAKLAGAARAKLNAAQEARVRKVNPLVAPEVEQVNEQRHGQRQAGKQKGRIQKAHSDEGKGGATEERHAWLHHPSGD